MMEKCDYWCGIEDIEIVNEAFSHDPHSNP
jgi:hypothetical protein